jgi:serine/threonine protein kinase
MYELSSPRRESLPADIAAEVAGHCDRYAAARQLGNEPPLNDFLSDLEEPVRSAVRSEIEQLLAGVQGVAAESCVAADTSSPVGQTLGEAGQTERTWGTMTVDDARGSTNVGHQEAPAGDTQVEDLASEPADPYGTVWQNPDTGSTPESTPRRMSNAVTASARYRDLLIFKRGGLGLLYRAHDESLHRETIVKFLNENCSGDPAALAQFQIEAEITARLDHPGVVPVYGIGETFDRRPFYVMQLISGRELREAIQEFHDLPAAKRGTAVGRRQLYTLLEHLVSACNTVAYAHDVGILHCDLKPANIMIGRYGETFVLDWGLAGAYERTNSTAAIEPAMRPRAANDSVSGPRGGTYGYMSPEQLDSTAAIGPATDLYSLGATLYEILTGMPPFDGRDTEVVNKIRAGDYRRPRELKPGIPWRLEAICAKAMSLRPEARYRTAKQLAADLSNWMRDEEIVAAPDRWYHRISRFSRRHRALTGALVLGLIAVVVAGGLIDRARRLAEHERELRMVEAQKAETEAENAKLVRKNFETSLDTFEDLCRPLVNGEFSTLGVLRPFVDRIHEFSTRYLDATPLSSDLNRARIHELRAMVLRIQDSDSLQALRDYQRAADIYRAEADNNPPGNDFLHRRAYIQLCQGQIYNRRQEFDKADPLLAQACQTLEIELRELKAQDGVPHRSRLQHDLAEVYHALGEVFLNGDAEGIVRQESLSRSQRFFENSKDLREGLYSESSGGERRHIQRDLARSLGYLGDLYEAQGQVAKAVDAYEVSKKLRKELYEANRLDPEHRFQFARGIGNFGYLDRDYRGNLDEAIKSFRDAEKLQSKLVEDYQEVDQFQLDRAATLNALAEVYVLAASRQATGTEDFAALAQDAVERARMIYERELEASDQSSDTDAAEGLALSFVVLAQLEQLNGQNPAEFARRAEQILHDRIVPDQELGRSALVTLAFSQSLQGQTAAALHSLKAAIDRGENTVARFESHLKAGLRAIADDPDWSPKLDALCQEIRKPMVFP